MDLSATISAVLFSQPPVSSACLVVTSVASHCSSSPFVQILFLTLHLTQYTQRCDHIYSQTPLQLFETRLFAPFVSGFFCHKVEFSEAPGKWVLPLPSCLGFAVTHSCVMSNKLKRREGAEGWHCSFALRRVIVRMTFSLFCLSCCNTIYRWSEHNPDMSLL